MSGLCRNPALWPKGLRQIQVIHANVLSNFLHRLLLADWFTGMLVTVLNPGRTGADVFLYVVPIVSASVLSISSECLFSAFKTTPLFILQSGLWEQKHQHGCFPMWHRFHSFGWFTVWSLELLLKDGIENDAGFRLKLTGVGLCPNMRFHLWASVKI